LENHKEYCPECFSPHIMKLSTLNSELNDIEEIAYCTPLKIYSGQNDDGCGWSGNPNQLLNEKQKINKERKLKLKKLNV